MEIIKKMLVKETLDVPRETLLISESLSVTVNQIQSMPVGCIVLVKVGDDTYVGWSKCSSKDKFDQSTAEKLACDRALKEKKTLPSKECFRHFSPESVRKIIDFIADSYSRIIKTSLRGLAGLSGGSSPSL